MMLRDLGQRIRTRRERLGLKQQDVANALQVSPQAVSKWERGENAPDIAIVGALAKLLGVSTDWLLDTHRQGADTFEATVFVSNVSGAYEKSLHMAPRDFAAWANGILLQVTESVLKHDGVPVKYIGDGLLAFFAGTDHPRRAVQAAYLARTMVAEDLRIGLHTGDIYLGAIGHPDYARPDITSQAVNIAFLTMGWAEQNADSGVAATSDLVDRLDDAATGRQEDVNFKGIENPVTVCELPAP